MAESSPKRVENTVGKGEIARYEQFSHSVFERLVLQTRENEGLFWKELSPLFVRAWLHYFCIVTDVTLLIYNLYKVLFSQ